MAVVRFACNDQLVDDEDRKHGMQRLWILDALAVGMERRDEVFAVVSAAPDADAARHHLMGHFGFDDVQAVAVMDLQIRRLAERERQKITDERTELRRVLGLI